MDGDDVRMREAGGRPRFAQEALAYALVVGEVQRERLDRHEAVEPQVAGKEDHAHAATPELALERVLLAEDGFEIEQLARSCGHDPSCRRPRESTRACVRMSPSIGMPR